MNKLILTAAALTIVASATTATARTSSVTEFRGYSACLDAAREDSRGLVAKRTYLIDRDGASTTYYINATRWNGDAREAVRVACETSARGQRLLSASTEPGRFTRERGSVTVEVATR